MLSAAVTLFLTLVQLRAEDLILLKKCCGVNEALNGYASACEPAPWPQYDLDYDLRKHVRTANESWLRRWVPPGVPLGVVKNVDIEQMYRFSENSLRVPVRTSGLAEGAKGDDWRRDHVLFGDIYVYRRSPEGGVREGKYCADAALEPYPAPFALLLENNCIDKHECIATCCYLGDVLFEAVNGSWSCASNNSLSRSSVAALRRTWDPEVPFYIGVSMGQLQLHGEGGLRQRCPEGRYSTHRLSTDASARTLTRWNTEDFFSTTLSCVSYIVRADGTAEHVAVHCDVPRWSRAFYWCTRPLSFVSLLLLLAAEASIVFSPRLRNSVHGWSLGCHAGCLLAFNILQIAFYLSVSDDADSGIFRYEDIAMACTALALLIYFFLTAASCWLTVICLNMNTGFKATRVARTGRQKRRFLMLSAFAWGIPVILTVACGILLLGKYEYTTPFHPIMMETRTCFDELVQEREWGASGARDEFKSYKGGSALFYYAPMAVLSVVNVICVIRTVLRVRFLTHGNSVLHRATRQRYKIDDREEQASSKRGIRQERTQRAGSPHAPKSVSVYIKLLLSAGVLELTAETIAWICTTYTSNGHIWLDEIDLLEKMFSYRAVGFLTDLARAVIVLWLAAPHAGDLPVFCCRLRRS